jgi:hypothetical protein
MERDMVTSDELPSQRSGSVAGTATLRPADYRHVAGG